MNQQDIDNLLAARKTLAGYVNSNLASLDGIKEAVTTILMVEAEAPNLVQDPSLLDNPKLIDIVNEIKGTLELPEPSEAISSAMEQHKAKIAGVDEAIAAAVHSLLNPEGGGEAPELTEKVVADIASSFAWAMSNHLLSQLGQIISLAEAKLTEQESDTIDVSVVVEKLLPNIFAIVGASAADFGPQVATKEDLQNAHAEEVPV
jgi:hypothetical protein